jgi:hypothetical protein
VNLESLGNIGEFVGAIAVVASLLYLALQARHNTAALRSAAYRDATDSAAQVNALLAQDASLSELFGRGILDFASLDSTQQIQVGAVLGTLFGVYQELYYQQSKGHLDEELWAGFHTALSGFMRQPGVRDWWPTRAQLYSASFRELVASIQEGHTV